MAQALIPKPTSDGYNMEGQTENVLNRIIYESTKGDARHADLNAEAFQKIQDQDPRDQFGPQITDSDVKMVINRLLEHVNNMKNDKELQRAISNIKAKGVNFLLEAMKKMCKELFQYAGSHWIGICVVFTITLLLCLAFDVAFFPKIIKTATSVIAELAHDWITRIGGWLKVLG